MARHSDLVLYVTRYLSNFYEFSTDAIPLRVLDFGRLTDETSEIRVTGIDDVPPNNVVKITKWSLQLKPQEILMVIDEFDYTGVFKDVQGNKFRFRQIEQNDRVRQLLVPAFREQQNRNRVEHGVEYIDNLVQTFENAPRVANITINLT